mmetsp:Transcript_67652/g.133518  ORF Transcript_67652/g.133518 Transcript_67652/m.133518 type:complete len:130 (-) Transcript_67652:466-855(-)
MAQSVATQRRHSNELVEWKGRRGSPALLDTSVTSLIKPKKKKRYGSAMFTAWPGFTACKTFAKPWDLLIANMTVKDHMQTTQIVEPSSRTFALRHVNSQARVRCPLKKSIIVIKDEAVPTNTDSAIVRN